MRRWLVPAAALLCAVACNDDGPTVIVPQPTPTPTADLTKIAVPGLHENKGIAAGEIRFISSDPAPGSALAGCSVECLLSLNLGVTMINSWWPDHAHVYGTAGGNCNVNIEGVQVPLAQSFGTTINLRIRGCTTTATLSNLRIFLYADQDYDNAVTQDFAVTYTLRP
jgi:hypothetical protein